MIAPPNKPRSTKLSSAAAIAIATLPLYVSLSVSSQSASLVSFSPSAPLFSPQLSTLLYCFGNSSEDYSQHISFACRLSCIISISPVLWYRSFSSSFLSFFLNKTNARSKCKWQIHNLNPQSCTWSILHLVRAVTKDEDDKDGVQR